MKPVKVVCGLIWKNDRVFIAKRKTGKPHAGYWEFPGGKIKKGENAESALIRELEEEFGMQVRCGDFAGSYEWTDGMTSIELHGYLCIFVSASFHLTDHDDYAFVNPYDLTKYQLTPADFYFIEKCQLHHGLIK
jgi:8-oxo-dGTP diphosphatase